MAFSLLEYLFFLLEIFTFLYCANEESDDVIDRSTKTVQHSIKNISLKSALFLDHDDIYAMEIYFTY